MQRVAVDPLVQIIRDQRIFRGSTDDDIHRCSRSFRLLRQHKQRGCAHAAADNQNTLARFGNIPAAADRANNIKLVTWSSRSHKLRPFAYHLVQDGHATRFGIGIKNRKRASQDMLTEAVELHVHKLPRQYKRSHLGAFQLHDVKARPYVIVSKDYRLLIYQSHVFLLFRAAQQRISTVWKQRAAFS